MGPNELQMMFQNGMGSLGAMQLGRQTVTGNQMDDAKLQEQGLINQGHQLANSQTAAMNPLNQQFMQGRIAQQGAELPGIVGQSQTAAAQGKYDTDVLPTKIAARISQLGDQIGGDGMRKLGREGEIALQTSELLKQYPPAMHKEVAVQIMQKYGVDQNSPLVKGIMQAPPEQIAQSLADTGKGMAMASSDYLQKTALEKQKTDSAERLEDTRVAGQVYTAKIGASSRVQAAEARAQALMQRMSPDQKIVALEDLARSGNATDADLQELKNLKAHVYTTRAAGANALPAQMTGQSTPIANAQAAAGASPAQVAPAPSPVELQTAVQKAGWQYEPTKYQYRVGPNGNVQRAPLR